MGASAWSTVELIWRESLAAGGLIVACTAVGWRLGGDRRRWWSRGVAWWLRHVVRPALSVPSWSRRSVFIAVNNSIICAALVLLGGLELTAWLGVLGVGLSLGIALRAMSADPVPSRNGGPLTPGGRLLERIGVGLNLLEVPAIMLAGGLSLSQGAMADKLDLAGAMSGFGVCVLPLLLIGAAGEGLWMTVGRHSV